MKILVSAYACEPGKGSEPGAGWLWARAAARRHEVWVLTRENNRDAIEAALERRERGTLRFVYLDLPPAVRRWKRGQRGVRLYYLLWQLRAAVEARRLQKLHGFDLVQHLTFANLWLPAGVCVAGAPFVLGPVGGGASVPWRLYRSLGLKGALHETLLRAARLASRANPLVRLAWWRAAAIIVQNEETLRALPARHRAKALVRPNASVGAATERRTAPPLDRLALYAGRLVPWKGVALALEAIAELDGWRLLIVGRGPDRARLERRAAELGISSRVSFEAWVPQAELSAAYRGAAALLVPSLREDASLAAAEAQAHGVPVVAFDRGGPRALAAFPGTRIELVPCGRRRECVTGFAEALRRIEREPLPVPTADFGIEGVARDLERVYARVAAGRATVEALA